MCKQGRQTTKLRVFLTGAILLFILFVALFLRTQHLTEVTYLFDESFSLKMTEFSLTELWQRVSQDTHPPLSFILLKLWVMLFGTSMFSTRMFGITFGMITIVCVYLFVKEAYSAEGQSKVENLNPLPLAALLAATFIALSPIQISWSLIARMYSLGTALTAFSSWFLMRALHQKSSGKQDWILFTFTAVALAYTHHFGLFIIAGQYCFAAGYLWFQSPDSVVQNRLLQLKPVFISALIFFWVWQPVLLNFLDQSERVEKLFYTRQFQLNDVGDTFYRLFISDQWSPQMKLIGLFIAQAVFIGLVLLLLGRRPADSFIFVSCAITFFMAILYSMTSRNIFKPRYFLFTQILLFAAAAILICRIPNKYLRRITIVASVSGLALCSHWNYQQREKNSQLPGMQAAVTRFDNISKTSEPLIVCNPLLYTTAITCTKNRDRIFTYTHGGGQEYPYFQGSSVMLESDYITTKKIDQTNSQSIWTLDENRWLKRKVPISNEWKLVEEISFPDYYCEPVLRLYERIQVIRDQQKLGQLEL